ncbi:AsnC family protein [Alteromonas confluentis]
MVSLDKTDIKILSALQDNARITHAELAKFLVYRVFVRVLP